MNLPAKDRPTSVDLAKLHPTGSRLHYYGIGVPVDYVKARHAAFAELDKPSDTMFGDTVILMMLYANGFGVAKNIDLAIKLGCDIGGAPMEIQGRIMHLDALRTRQDTTPFDICDDITSGDMAGHCEGLQEDRKQAVRARELDTLTTSWSKPQLDALRRLRGASEAFWDARASELDLSGTDRSAAITLEQAAGKQALLDALRRFERGDVPQQSVSDYEAADRELNRVYKVALAKDFSDTTATPQAVRLAEKKWIAFRDAWIALGKQRYPEVTAETWTAWLSEARTKQLSEL
jgi:uncharacterized protein YecT (DUF1311 family)